jgi:hypothetical protein
MTANVEAARQPEAPGAVISRGLAEPRQPRPTSRQRDAMREKMPTTRHARLTASEPGDAADQAVAFLEAAHLQEHSLMLVLQQPALNTGALAPAIASSCWSGPKDPPPQRRHQATASPLRHRRHDVDAMVVTPAGPASGRKAIVRHRAGHRDPP